jgi:ketosteroid isomerase-like protein
MSEINKEIVKKLNAAVRANNLDEFLSFFTDDIHWVKVGDKSAKGKEELRKLIEDLGDAPPPSTTVFDAMIAEGDTVAAYGSLTIEIQPEMTIGLVFCDIYRFEGDKIADFKSFVIAPEAKTELKSEN